MCHFLRFHTRELMFRYADKRCSIEHVASWVRLHIDFLPLHLSHSGAIFCSHSWNQINEIIILHDRKCVKIYTFNLTRATSLIYIYGQIFSTDIKWTKNVITCKERNGGKSFIILFIKHYHMFLSMQYLLIKKISTHIYSS